jgi:hypothetical protein
MARDTNILEKLIPSIINLFIILFLSLIVIYIFNIENTILRKIIFISIMFLYNLCISVFNKNRCIGMIIMNTYWDKEYSLTNRILYALLYTLSFSTLLFYIYFPYDLLLFNLLLIQLPFILTKHTTAHGYLSGNMKSIKKI